MYGNVVVATQKQGRSKRAQRREQTADEKSEQKKLGIRDKVLEYMKKRLYPQPDVAIENTADDNMEITQPDNVNLNVDQVLDPNILENVHPNQDMNPEALTDNDLPSLDPEILVALGELIPEEVTYGEDIHPDLAQRWAPILRKGLTDKEQREKLFKEYATPNNCKLFRAPILNPEIAAAVSEFARARDKKIEASQQQLGLGLTAINRAMSTLLSSDNKIHVIRNLSDACRVLSDLHAAETQTRTKSLTQGLDKSFLNLIQDTERDEMLFGNGLPEKIKASKAIEKQGSQIKKPDNKAAPGPSTSRATRPQGNWRGPSRSNRGGGRGGSRRTPYMNQKNVSTTQQNSFHPSRVWNRPPRAGPRT